MTNVVKLAEHKNGFNDMLYILGEVTKRVQDGEITGLIITQTTPDHSLTYTSGAGLCLSYTMVGLLQATAVDLSNQINENCEIE